jgi:hypothetical protein
MRFDALANVGFKVAAFWKGAPWGMIQVQNANTSQEHAAFILPHNEIPPKCRYLFTSLHGVIFYNIVILLLLLRFLICMWNVWTFLNVLVTELNFISDWLNIVTHMTIARQRLGKRIPELTLSIIVGRPLLGSESLGTFPQQRIDTQW